MLQFADVDVGVTHDHADRLPAAKTHQCAEVAVCGVVPRRPGVTAIVRMKVRNPGAPAGARECTLDARARGRVLGVPEPAVGLAVRPAEDFAIAAIQVRQFGDNARMQRNAPRFPVLVLGNVTWARLRSRVLQSSHKASPARAPVYSMKITIGRR